SITSDEAAHYNYSVRLIKGLPEKVITYSDASTMPVSVLNVTPRIVESILFNTKKKFDGGESDIINGRYITLLISALIGLFIFMWAKDLYGEDAGLAALFFFIFCPNINAHSTLVTTDAYAALFTIACAYYFWKLNTEFSWKYLILFSISLGIAQVSKQSLTHLIFIFLILSITYALINKSIFKNFSLKFLSFFCVCLIVLLIINTSFLFFKFGHSINDYQFKSNFFINIQSSFKAVGEIPLPFPEPYIKGLDLTKHLDEIGPGDRKTSGVITILGNRKASEGFWYYYFVSVFFKSPISIILLTGLMLIYAIKRSGSSIINKEFSLLFIVFYLLMYFSFFYNSQVGIRHVIMIYPLIYVLISKFFIFYKNKTVLLLLFTYSLATFYYYLPNLISYTNEFVLPKRMAYKVVGGSNLDFKQGNKWASEYLAKHAEVQKVSETPKTGKILMSVEEFMDLYNTQQYKWIHQFSPVGHLKHSHLLFHITEDDLKKVEHTR
ncbi:MAG: glycosyltransferase family 39 protein, partial [Bacteroidota bacterium]|nr:glycosyltransferase family 39 protein [Bacteroidota bacterium]